MTHGFRGMPSKKASIKKNFGHIVECKFEKIIDGKANPKSRPDKADVVDNFNRSHSVKAGKQWQIFFYGESRFKEDPMFKGLEISPIMIDIINTLPGRRSDYTENETIKIQSKLKRQPLIRILHNKLSNENISKAFLSESIFKGNVDYLTICPFTSDDDITKIYFEIFSRDDVLDVIQKDTYWKTSKAIKQSDMDDQKVGLRSKFLNNKQIGFVELTTDKSSYRRIRFRLDRIPTLKILKGTINNRKQWNDKIITYGKATEILFRR